MFRGLSLPMTIFFFFLHTYPALFYYTKSHVYIQKFHIPISCSMKPTYLISNLFNPYWPCSNCLAKLHSVSFKITQSLITLITSNHPFQYSRTNIHRWRTNTVQTVPCALHLSTPFLKSSKIHDQILTKPFYYFIVQQLRILLQEHVTCSLITKLEIFTENSI